MVRCKDFIKIHFLAESKKGTRNRKPEGLYNLHSCRSQVIAALFKKARILLFATSSWLSSCILPALTRSISSVAQLCLTLRHHELQHARPLSLTPTPGAYSNSCPLSQWCHPTISSSVVPFSSCPQSFAASESFHMNQLFASGGQSIVVSASAPVLPMNTQDWSPLGWTGWISLQSKGLSRVFSNTIVQKHQFLSTQLTL